MIANRSESRNFSATSTIDDQNIAGFNAYYSPLGSLTFSTEITDVALYKANKQTVDQDEAEWKAEVEEAVFGE